MPAERQRDHDFFFSRAGERQLRPPTGETRERSIVKFGRTSNETKRFHEAPRCHGACVSEIASRPWKCFLRFMRGRDVVARFNLRCRRGSIALKCTGGSFVTPVSGLSRSTPVTERNHTFQRDCVSAASFFRPRARQLIKNGARRIVFGRSGEDGRESVPLFPDACKRRIREP